MGTRAGALFAGASAAASGTSAIPSSSQVTTGRSTNPGGVVCQPDWSPDGLEVMFVAIDPRANRFRPIVIEIDPETRAAVDQRDFLVPGIDGDVLRFPLRCPNRSSGRGSDLPAPLRAGLCSPP